MIIDGKAIADTILTKLTDTVGTLKKAGITPKLAVILIGDDPGSLSYIKQKQKTAESIGAQVVFEHMPDTTSPGTLQSAIVHYNGDPLVHGLIIQRPVPQFVGAVGDILATVAPGKDVDGFVPHSPFEVPVAKATITILEHVHAQLAKAQLTKNEFTSWLNNQTIAVIGRGETAGSPIAALLAKYGSTPSVIHSKTPNPKKILKLATIVISCVGREGVVTKGMINRGTILISVGLTKNKDGKLHGDYEEADIKNVASFYTPTPGGVGPVNVAALMQNLVDACIMTIDTPKK